MLCVVSPSIAAMSKQRTMLVAAGTKQAHYTVCAAELSSYSNVLIADLLPRHANEGDTGKGKKGELNDSNWMEAIVSKEKFGEALAQVCWQAASNTRTCVACHWGTHRAPAVTAVAAECLKAAGWSVAVLELKLVPPFLWQRVLAEAEDRMIAGNVF